MLKSTQYIPPQMFAASESVSCQFLCPAISCPAISCPAISRPAILRPAFLCLQFHVLHFHVLSFGPSFSLMPCTVTLVRQFHVRHFHVHHFQRPHWNSPGYERYIYVVKVDRNAPELSCCAPQIVTLRFWVHNLLRSCRNLGLWLPEL